MKKQIAMPIAIVVILIAVIIPLPTIILDILISANISISVVILLSAVYLLNPVQFSSFPSILLMTTLFRLSLNIASTRLILMNGNQGMAAAGDVIQAFGQFVVGGNYAVGINIFIVLIVIQYVVINHGAVRSRLSKSGMPIATSVSRCTGCPTPSTCEGSTSLV
jgi:flagellar biosynthesis protein FlhA